MPSSYSEVLHVGLRSTCDIWFSFAKACNCERSGLEILLQIMTVRRKIPNPCHEHLRKNAWSESCSMRCEALLAHEKSSCVIKSLIATQRSAWCIHNSTNSIWNRENKVILHLHFLQAHLCLAVRSNIRNKIKVLSGDIFSKNFSEVTLTYSGTSFSSKCFKHKQ